MITGDTRPGTTLFRKNERRTRRAGGPTGLGPIPTPNLLYQSDHADGATPETNPLGTPYPTTGWEPPPPPTQQSNCAWNDNIIMIIIKWPECHTVYRCISQACRIWQSSRLHKKSRYKNPPAHYQPATYLQLLRQFTVHKSGGKKCRLPTGRAWITCMAPGTP